MTTAMPAALLSIFCAAPAFSQGYAPPQEDLQPPSSAGDENLQTKVRMLEGQLKDAQDQLARKRAAEAEAPPAALVDSVEKDYKLDPANRDLAPELRGRIRIYTAKRTARKPPAERHLLLVPSDVSPRRSVVLPTVDCEAAEDKGVRVVGGRFLAAATDKGVFYSDLSRPASADEPCESFVAAGVVRYGRVAAVQSLRSLELLPDALREAGFAPSDARAASGSAERMVGGREQYEIYGNKDRLLATYPVKDGAGLTVFWLVPPKGLGN